MVLMESCGRFSSRNGNARAVLIMVVSRSQFANEALAQPGLKPRKLFFAALPRVLNGTLLGLKSDASTGLPPANQLATFLSAAVLESITDMSSFQDLTNALAPS